MYTRQLNNCLSMACPKVNHSPGHLETMGWQPTVTIQCKVYILIAVRRLSVERDTECVQLYVMDPDHAQYENEVGLATVTLSKSAITQEKPVVLSLIEILQLDA